MFQETFGHKNGSPSFQRWHPTLTAPDQFCRPIPFVPRIYSMQWMISTSLSALKALTTRIKIQRKQRQRPTACLLAMTCVMVSITGNTLHMKLKTLQFDRQVGLLDHGEELREVCACKRGKCVHYADTRQLAS